MSFTKSKLILFFLLITFGIIFFVAPQVQAQLTTQIIPAACTDESAATTCEVVHIIQTLINVTQWILAILGSVALVMFIYGGFIWLTAAGNTARVDKGRKVLVGTVVGIVIVLGAFTLVRFIGESFGVTGGDFDTYLDTTTSGRSSSGGVCQADGDRCFKYNQNIYACVGGNCSDVSLCLYWVSDYTVTGNSNIFGVTSDYWCRASTSCNPSTIVRGLCPGDPDPVCCIAN